MSFYVFSQDVTKFYSGREVRHCLNLYIQEEGGEGGIDGTKKGKLGMKIDPGLHILPPRFRYALGAESKCLVCESTCA